MNQSKEHIKAKISIENLRNKTSNNEKFGTYLRFLNPNSFAICLKTLMITSCH